MVNIPVIQEQEVSPWAGFAAGLGQGLVGGVSQGIGGALKQRIFQKALSDVDIGNEESVRRAILSLPPSLQQEGLNLLTQSAAPSIAMQKGQQPPLSVSQQLSAVRARVDAQIKNIMLPYSVEDSFGRLVAFRGDVGEQKKKEIIAKTEKVLDTGRRAQVRIYQNAGLEVPEDLEDVLLSNVFGPEFDITNEMKEPFPGSLDQALREGNKYPWDPNNPSHQNLANEALKKAKGNEDKARMILDKIFITTT